MPAEELIGLARSLIPIFTIGIIAIVLVSAVLNPLLQRFTVEESNPMHWMVDAWISLVLVALAVVIITLLLALLSKPQRPPLIRL